MLDSLRHFTLALAIALGMTLLPTSGKAGWRDSVSQPRSGVSLSLQGGHVHVQWTQPRGRFWGRASPDANRLARRLEAAWALCGRLPASYSVDCLAEEYKATAATIPRSSELAPVRAVILNAAAELESTVAANRDPNQPLVRAQANGRRTTPITPVRPDAANRVRAAASETVAAAGLILLRSVPGEDPRAANFQRIAAAFEETAVLLRS